MKSLNQTGLGKLRLWHQRQYKPYEGIAFEDRSPGDLLEEFYQFVAVEVESLDQRRADLTPDELERLYDLEEVLKPTADQRLSLVGLTDEESEEVWETPNKTGDPLADYWEYRIAKDLPVDLELKEVPPRDEWDEVA